MDEATLRIIDWVLKIRKKPEFVIGGKSYNALLAFFLGARQGMGKEMYLESTWR